MKATPRRRRSTRGTLLGTGALICFSAFAFSARAGDWPQFLGPARNGSSAETNLAVQWPKDGPPILWQRKAGNGFAGPVVNGERLILFHRVGNEEVVEAVDATTGRDLWKASYPTGFRDEMFGTDDGPRATPAIVGGRVYTFGAEGALHAWDLASGAKVWGVDTKRTHGAREGFFGMACSPLVEGGAVIINIGGKDGAGIVAFDKATGKELWRATDDEASYASPVSADLGGRRRTLVLTRAALVALDPADGKLFFRFPWRPPMSASVSAATPLVIGETILISASYGTGASLMRFREKAPEKIWSADEVLSNHYATSVHHDGFLYGFDGRQEQGCDLRCVELQTGKVRWSEGGLGAGTVTLAGGQLLVLTEKGLLIRAPATPGGFKPAGRAQVMPFNVRAHPALANGLFYARSRDKLFCIDLRPAR